MLFQLKGKNPAETGEGTGTFSTKARFVAAGTRQKTLRIPQPLSIIQRNLFYTKTEVNFNLLITFSSLNFALKLAILQGSYCGNCQRPE